MRETLKHLANGVAVLLVLPAFGLYRVGQRVLGAERAFAGWSQAWSLVPGLLGVYLRRAFYRLILPRCAADSWVSFGTVISHPTAEVGSNVYVGLFCCLGNVIVEDDVLLGSHVSVMNGGAQHGIERLDVPIRKQSGAWPRVRIGRDTWIGDRAVVMADVGNHCVIGAGSVVTRPVPDYAIAHGVPAKVVRFRNGEAPSASEPKPAPRPADGQNKVAGAVPSPC